MFYLADGFRCRNIFVFQHKPTKIVLSMVHGTEIPAARHTNIRYLHYNSFMHKSRVQTVAIYCDRIRRLITKYLSIIDMIHINLSLFFVNFVFTFRKMTILDTVHPKGDTTIYFL